MGPVAFVALRVRRHFLRYRPIKGGGEVEGPRVMTFSILPLV